VASLKKSLALIAAGGAVGTGAVALLQHARRQRRDHRVFVLEYHEICRSGDEREGSVSIDRFRQHVRHLKKRFRLVTVEQAARLLLEPGALREDALAISLDDGYAGNYELAWPVLADEGVPATIYVTTGFIDGTDLWFDSASRHMEAALETAAELPAELKRRIVEDLGSWPPASAAGVERFIERLKYLERPRRDAIVAALAAACPPRRPAAAPLTWGQVRKMQAAGIEVGAHTVTHPILSTLTREEQRTEILRSRERIAEQTGIIPTTFAYPNGAETDFDEDTTSIVEQAGFLAACTTVRGSNRPGCDMYALRRLGVGGDPCFLLETRLAGLFDQEIRERFAQPWRVQ